jgi:aerobic carbon-monoxide dehydrogenase small subunit
VKTSIWLTVNARAHTVEVDTRTCLVDFLRDDLELTGVHVGCRTGNCGACTIIMGGQTVKSCVILAADAHGQDITTIEAMSTTLKDLHPIQQEFAAHQGLQCGYCTPAMILSVLQLLSTNPDPTDDEIRLGIAGNLCRCTGYHFIVDSIHAAARRLAGTRIDMTSIGATDNSTAVTQL